MPTKEKLDEGGVENDVRDFNLMARNSVNHISISSPNVMALTDYEAEWAARIVNTLFTKILPDQRVVFYTGEEELEIFDLSSPEKPSITKVKASSEIVLEKSDKIRVGKKQQRRALLGQLAG